MAKRKRRGYTEHMRQRFARRYARRRMEFWQALGGRCERCGLEGPLGVLRIASRKTGQGRNGSSNKMMAGDWRAVVPQVMLLCRRCYGVRISDGSVALLRHGTTAAYRRGCRCVDCTRANSIQDQAYNGRTEATRAAGRRLLPTVLVRPPKGPAWARGKSRWRRPCVRTVIGHCATPVRKPAYSLTPKPPQKQRKPLKT